MSSYSKAMAKNAGYFYIHLTAISGRLFFDYSEDRAFFLLQVQDLLAYRSILSQQNHHGRLSLSIDLLAFSVLPDGVRLLMYSIDRKSADGLVQELMRRFKLHLRQHRAYAQPRKKQFHLKKLRGVHHALEVTAHIHARHQYNSETPYSSLGFYLNDRRGDWMRIWRIAKLYENNSGIYLDYLTRSHQARPSETLAHG